jgi:type I restriction enzyme S subunit
MFYKETNFRATDVGVVPTDWRAARLGDLSNDIFYGITAKAVEKKTGLRMLRTTDIVDYQVDWESLPCCEITEKRSKVERYLLRKNDLVIARAGTTGVSVLVKDDLGDTVFGSYLIKAALKQDLNPKFAHYFCQSQLYWHHIMRNKAGSTLKNISLPTLISLGIPLPSISEQVAIAEILASVDEAIQKTNEVITKTERLKRGLTQELLTKGIGHKEFKTTEVGEIPKEWDVITVGDVTTEHKQGFYTNQSYSSDGVRLVRITDLFNPRISYETMPFLNLDGHTVEQFGVSKGDFLIARSGAIGRFGIATENIPCVFGSYIIRFRFDQDRLSNDFFGWLFQSNFVLPQLLRLKHGATNININAENLKSIKIPLPKPAEQALLVLVLSTLARKLELDELDKLRLERTKAGLMDLLLTGKVRVKAN